MATDAKKSESSTPEDLKKSKTRSPNHPVVGLEKAIDLATQIEVSYGTHEVPLNLAHKLWGYKEWSAVADQCVAALKAYGLITVSGKSKGRKLALTQSGLRISRGAPDRHDLIRASATKPSIHAEIIEHFSKAGLPNDTLLKQYLVWDRPEGQRFNEDSVDAFIARFRQTLEYSGATVSDIISGENADDDDDESEIEFNVGDFVQWTSADEDQFPAPQPIISIDGDWAFFENSPTGIPMSELTIQDPPSENKKIWNKKRISPPSNPHYKPDPIETHDGPHVEFSLSGDNTLEIRLTKPVSKKDFDRIKKILELSEDSFVEEPE